MPAHPRPPQHRKQISMEMVRSADGNSSQSSPVLNSAPNRTEKWADQWTKRPRRGSGFVRPVLSRPAGLRPAGAGSGPRALQSIAGARRLCPVTAAEGASSSKGEHLNLVLENQNTALFRCKKTIFSRSSGLSGNPD